MNNDSAESAELDSVRTCRADGKIKYLLRPIHQHQQWNERKNEDEEKVLFLVQKLVAKQWRERTGGELFSPVFSVSSHKGAPQSMHTTGKLLLFGFPFFLQGRPAKTAESAAAEMSLCQGNRAGWREHVCISRRGRFRSADWAKLGKLRKKSATAFFGQLQQQETSP